MTETERSNLIKSFARVLYKLNGKDLEAGWKVSNKEILLVSRNFIHYPKLFKGRKVRLSTVEEFFKQ